MENETDEMLRYRGKKRFLLFIMLLCGITAIYLLDPLSYFPNEQATIESTKIIGTGEISSVHPVGDSNEQPHWVKKYSNETGTYVLIDPILGIYEKVQE